MQDAHPEEQADQVLNTGFGYQTIERQEGHCQKSDSGNGVERGNRVIPKNGGNRDSRQQKDKIEKQTWKPLREPVTRQQVQRRRSDDNEGADIGQKDRNLAVDHHHDKKTEDVLVQRPSRLSDDQNDCRDRQQRQDNRVLLRQNQVSCECAQSQNKEGNIDSQDRFVEVSKVAFHHLAVHAWKV